VRRALCVKETFSYPVPVNTPVARPEVLLTVDLVVLTVRDDRLQVLLIERGKEPFLGGLALPGGFLREGEDLDDAAIRELTEETGLDGRRLHLEQLRVYGRPGRDPRGRVVTVAYLAIAPNLPVPVAGTDARHARWAPVTEQLYSPPDPPVEPADPATTLVFDHPMILRHAIERAREELEYTTVAAAFCGESFTVTELRQVYETVWGRPLDPRNFHRKVLGAEGFLVPTGERRIPELGRPALLYRRGDARLLNPPMLRAESLAQRRQVG
jgi:8-oxo-dGTP diphosphatase